MTTNLISFTLAVLVVCIGLHALGEQRDSLGVVPRQVLRPLKAHVIWGRTLTACGGLALAIGLLGVSQPDLDLEAVLLGGQVICGLMLAAYSLWILVGSGRVAYQATPSVDSHH